MFRKGSKVKMTEDALDNYGEQYQDVVFKIIHKATKYMPAKEFYEKGQPEGYHPGYDEGVGNQALYDLEIVGSDKEFNNSLYDWELECV